MSIFFIYKKSKILDINDHLIVWERNIDAYKIMMQ